MRARQLTLLKRSPLQTDRTSARDSVGGAYLHLGTILSEDQPADALKSYRQAAVIYEELTATAPSNTMYRRSAVECQRSIGEALHRLGKNRAALDILAPALESMKSLVAAVPDEIEWV